MPKVDIELSPSVHEGAIRVHFLKDPGSGLIIPDEALGALLGAVEKVRKRGTAMVEKYKAIMADPSRPEVIRSALARKAVDRLTDEIRGIIEVGNQRYLAEYQKLERSMAIPLPKDVAERELYREIRQRFLSLSPKERDDVIDKARSTLNFPIMNAIVGSDPFLVGMDPKDHALRLASWQLLIHPDGVRRRERLNKAMAAYEQVEKLFNQTVARLKGLDADRLDREEALVRQAEQALADVGVS